ncbi:hypothetical protein [Alcanivorax quisquiliarum]|uniref:Uncharacterized protein n=1 Tax=Alcanivorax quisquiliarum TaxID=2933565 RepID=A0ABT0EAJ1_9GAMM|nr:hypothetical protein [Alcanivorax quisquiliarum]MCK0538883.1 hypothetical protein [Alcanivorax quisquiliarum]
MKPLVRQHLELLRSEYERRPYAELVAMKGQELAMMELDSRAYQPSVFTECYQGKLLLIVELRRKRLLGFGSADCLGSIIAKTGVIEQVDEEFLWREIGHP